MKCLLRAMVWAASHPLSKFPDKSTYHVILYIHARHPLPVECMSRKSPNPSHQTCRHLYPEIESESVPGSIEVHLEDCHIHDAADYVVVLAPIWILLHFHAIQLLSYGFQIGIGRPYLHIVELGALAMRKLGHFVSYAAIHLSPFRNDVSLVIFCSMQRYAGILVRNSSQLRLLSDFPMMQNFAILSWKTNPDSKAWSLCLTCCDSCISTRPERCPLDFSVPSERRMA